MNNSQNTPASSLSANSADALLDVPVDPQRVSAQVPFYDSLSEFNRDFESWLYVVEDKRRPWFDALDAGWRRRAVAKYLADDKWHQSHRDAKRREAGA